jgi:hypothetical protein
MRTTPAYLRTVAGLHWSRILGTGATFGPWPNWHRYALLAEWADEAAARHFLQESPLVATWKARGWRLQTTWLAPVASRGAWDGATPFCPDIATDALRDDEPVAVLTRATIRWYRLWAFWRAVPAASRAALAAPGLRTSISLGELPLIRQATLSIWESVAQMKAFAYGGATDHQTVVQRKRTGNWYNEELFARFRVLKVEEADVSC